MESLRNSGCLHAAGHMTQLKTVDNSSWLVGLK